MLDKKGELSCSHAKRERCVRPSPGVKENRVIAGGRSPPGYFKTNWAEGLTVDFKVERTAGPVLEDRYKTTARLRHNAQTRVAGERFINPRMSSAYTANLNGHDSAVGHGRFTVNVCCFIKQLS